MTHRSSARRKGRGSSDGADVVSGCVVLCRAIGNNIYFCGLGDGLTKDLNLDIPEGGVESDGHDGGCSA